MYVDPRKWLRSVQWPVKTINSTNLSGAIDIIVVKQDDGTLRCTPFHVRFGKLRVMRASQQEVYIAINDQVIDNIRMQLGEAGEALFINDIDVSSVSTDIGPQPDLSNIDQSPQFINKELDGQSSPTINVDMMTQIGETISGSGQRCNHEKQRTVRHILDVQSSEDEQNLEDTFSTEQQVHRRKRVSMPITKSLDDDNKISLSSKQEQSENNEGIYTGVYENEELLEIQTTNVSSNPIFINSSSIIERLSESAIESDTTMNDIFKPLLSQSVPIESSTVITTGSFSIPSNETDNRVSNYGLSDNFSLTQSVESLQLDADYELEKSTQSLINTQETLANRITGIWQWKWGELPQQRAAQLIRRSSRFFSNFWPVSKRATSTEDIPSDHITSNRYDEPTRHLSTINSHQLQQKTTDDDHQKSDKNNFIPQSPPRNDKFPDIQFSLCGNFNNQSLITDDLFNTHLVSFETFDNNPDIVNDPNFIVRIDGKFYTWAMASSLYASMERQPSFDNKNCTKITPSTSNVEIKTTSFETQLSVENNNFENISKTENDHYMKMKEKLQLSSSSTTSLKTLEKTMILSSDQLKRLDLKPGVNKVKFSVTTALQGSHDVEANMFLFDQNTKFVISDIDGTITKSDVFGHIFAWFGHNWTHDNIAQFFNAIQENGYQFIYLSARGIGQSQMTRNFLSRMEQYQCPLPLGPLFISPDSLMTALYREIIAKKPEEFKIECLNNIASLFPNKNPFYAGFGNRSNDQYAYMTVGIPATHIFTINHQSVIIREKLCRVQSYSYKDLHDVVDLIFPPMDSFLSSENYSTFTYWRTNPTMDVFNDEIQAQIDEINEREKQSKARIKKQQKLK